MRDADGADPHASSLRLNSLTCPATANFCIKNLEVSSGGAKIESGDGSPYYGIAIGKFGGSPLDLGHDGIGPVDLTVGASSNDDVEASMNVQSPSAGCGGTAACVLSYDTGPDPVGDPGDSGTVIGSIGWTDGVSPPTYPTCAGGTGSYERAAFTTGDVTARISNEDGANQSISETGSSLSGSSLVLKTPHVIFRTKVLGITLATDSMGTLTFDGTLCKPAGNCIPNEESFCPAEDD